MITHIFINLYYNGFMKCSCIPTFVSVFILIRKAALVRREEENCSLFKLQEWVLEISRTPEIPR